MITHKTYKFTLKKAPLLLRHLFADAKLYISPLENGDKKRFYIPTTISGELLQEYKDTLDWIEKYYQTFSKQKKYKKQSFELISYAHLVNIQVEATQAQVLGALSKLIIFEDAYFKSLVASLERVIETKANATLDISELIPQPIPTERANIKLSSYRPLNEMDILSEAIYESTWLNQSSVHDSIDELSYKDKYSLLKKVEIINSSYTYETIAEPSSVYELKSDIQLDSVRTQELSPYYGYDVAEDSNNESIAEMAERCFDMSYKLYGKLQETSNQELAQLAVLFGHRQRYKFTIQHLELKRLDRSGNQSPIKSGVLALAQQKHPTLFENFISIDN